MKFTHKDFNKLVAVADRYYMYDSKYDNRTTNRYLAFDHEADSHIYLARTKYFIFFIYESNGTRYKEVIRNYTDYNRVVKLIKTFFKEA